MEQVIIGAVCGGGVVLVTRIVFDWLKPSTRNNGNGNGKGYNGIEAALTKKAVDDISSEIRLMSTGITDLKSSSFQTNLLLSDILTEQKETRKHLTCSKN